MTNSTLKEIIENSYTSYSELDAIRYKAIKKDSEGNKTTVIETKTYTDLKHDSERVSNALTTLKQSKKHIAILGTTSYLWIISYLGIVNSGGVVVPLDALLPEEEICDLINRADVTTLIFDESKAKIASVALENCPKLEYVVSTKETSKVDNALILKELIDKEKPGYDYTPKPEDLATIMFTSGTTGKSKGVMLTHRNLAENATCLDMKFEVGTVLMSVLPIHHAFCLGNDILKALSVGAVICINDSLLRVAKNIKLFKPNVILMVPLMIDTLVKKLEEKSWIPAPIVKVKAFGKQLHTIISGGAYLNPEYIKRFKKYKIDILQGYGMTECSPVISVNCPWNNKIGSVGKLMPNCEAKIVDEELWVRGSSVMQGYYNMPEETAETIVDGWLRTGDLAHIDDDGFLFLTGRKKNLIITPNGENVSPEEIENALGDNRLINEVIVRDSEGVIEAEIFPDYDYASKKKITDIEGELQKIIDTYNKKAPLYKRIVKLKIRDVEFEKNTTKKIKRF